MSRFRPLSDMLFSKPIKINCLLHSSEIGSYPCFSEDSDFVAVFVKTDVDVWHLKSGVDRHGSDATLIMGAHR